MFDGDNAGIRASYKAAIMSLPFLAPEKFLQFVLIPNNLDPDNYLNIYSFEELIKLLKDPVSLVHFIFNQSSNALHFKNADDKIMFDKYLDDIIVTIKNKKIQYFYRNEFKNLFYKKLKGTKKLEKNNIFLSTPSSLIEKQILAFIAAFLHHQTVRKDIIKILKIANFLEAKHQKLLLYLDNSSIFNQISKEIINNCSDLECKKILNKSLENQITLLFPFASNKYDSQQAKLEIEDSVKNLNPRLLNLKKINKSLNTFVSDTSNLNWGELQRINQEIQNDQLKE